jgi:negative regulator of flagellin synthesis FlgM
MPSMELGSTAPVGAIDVRIARQPQASECAPPSTEKPAASVVASTALDAGEIPVDEGRVAVIRKAVESGNYPLIPARISDAMIAAGLLLRSSRA